MTLANGSDPAEASRDEAELTATCAALARHHFARTDLAAPHVADPRQLWLPLY
jgi:hypothetical protein